MKPGVIHMDKAHIVIGMNSVWTVKFQKKKDRQTLGIDDGTYDEPLFKRLETNRETPRSQQEFRKIIADLITMDMWNYLKNRRLARKWSVLSWLQKSDEPTFLISAVVLLAIFLVTKKVESVLPANLFLPTQKYIRRTGQTLLEGINQYLSS